MSAPYPLAWVCPECFLRRTGNLPKAAKENWNAEPCCICRRTPGAIVPVKAESRARKAGAR